MTSRPLRPDGSDSKLDELRRSYPGWRIWRGLATGDVWALPPRGHPQPWLISAVDADELAAKIAAVSGTFGTSEVSADPAVDADAALLTR